MKIFLNDGRKALIDEASNNVCVIKAYAPVVDSYQAICSWMKQNVSELSSLQTSQVRGKEMRAVLGARKGFLLIRVEFGMFLFSSF